MPKVKAWKVGAAGEPSFPEDYEVAKRAVLQVTDIKTNHNKYYGIELHSAQAPGFGSSRTTVAPTTSRTTPTPASERRGMSAAG